MLVATTSHPSRRPPRRDHVPSVGVNRAAGAPAFARAAFPPPLAVGPFPGRIDWLPRRILHHFDTISGTRALALAEPCDAV